MKKTVAILALVLFAAVAWAQVANVSSDWYAGNLRFKDSSGNVIATFDGTNRKLEIPSGSTLDIPAGTVARAELVEDALQPYGIPIVGLQQTTGIPLAVTETAGNFNVDVTTNVILAKAEITDNETEVSVTQFQFVLPPEYVSGGDISIRLPVAIVKTGAGSNNGSTIDCSVYKQASGAVGSDLVTTAAQTFAALDTWYNKDFVVTPTGLVAGDILNVVISSSVIDNEAGAGTLRLNMSPPRVLLDVKG